MAADKRQKPTATPADAVRQRNAQAQKAQREADALYYGVFEGHPDGAKIFADLASKFYDRTSVSQLADGSVDIHASMVREGERIVILYIMQRLSRYQEGRG